MNKCQLYQSRLHNLVNQVLFPVKMLVPQPIIKKIPYLSTNYEIRTSMVLSHVHGRLLDIGCGENLLVSKHKNRGGSGLGVDVHPWKGVDMLVKDTATLPFEDESFDSISFVACLNHIPNRIDVLTEARRLLKRDGSLLITNLTPVISRIWHAYSFWDQDQHERGMKEGEVYGFDHPQLIALVTEAGFVYQRNVPFSWGLNRLYIFQK